MDELLNFQRNKIIMNNREIKFRAWEKTLKKIIFVKDIDFKAKIINNSVAWRFFSEVELMQFTGLKDNKGVEIYEGDIVNVNEGNHIIEWRGAGFAATWSDYNLDTCWFVGGGPVVIGNIFENPELAERARKGPRVR